MKDILNLPCKTDTGKKPKKCMIDLLKNIKLNGMGARNE